MDENTKKDYKRCILIQILAIYGYVYTFSHGNAVISLLLSVIVTISSIVVCIYQRRYFNHINLTSKILVIVSFVYIISDILSLITY